MNRPKLIKQIIDYYKIFGPKIQADMMIETLRRVPDMDLWVLAKTLGLKPEFSLR